MTTARDLRGDFEQAASRLPAPPPAEPESVMARARRRQHLRRGVGGGLGMVAVVAVAGAVLLPEVLPEGLEPSSPVPMVEHETWGTIVVCSIGAPGDCGGPSVQEVRDETLDRIQAHDGLLEVRDVPPDEERERWAEFFADDLFEDNDVTLSGLVDVLAQDAQTLRDLADALDDLPVTIMHGGDAPADLRMAEGPVEGEARTVYRAELTGYGQVELQFFVDDEYRCIGDPEGNRACSPPKLTRATPSPVVDVPPAQPESDSQPYAGCVHSFLSREVVQADLEGPHGILPMHLTEIDPASGDQLAILCVEDTRELTMHTTTQDETYEAEAHSVGPRGGL